MGYLEQPQLETLQELVDAIEHGGGMSGGMDDPVYVRTPHGSYHFVVQDVERVRVNNEVRTVIVVREVEWPDS